MTKPLDALCCLPSLFDIKKLNTILTINYKKHQIRNHYFSLVYASEAVKTKSNAIKDTVEVYFC